MVKNSLCTDENTEGRVYPPFLALDRYTMEVGLPSSLCLTTTTLQAVAYLQVGRGVAPITLVAECLILHSVQLVPSTPTTSPPPNTLGSWQ